LCRDAAALQQEMSDLRHQDTSGSEPDFKGSGRCPGWKLAGLSGCRG
jgi:hypothetical protein